MHDSRDNQDMPVSGWYANLNWLANRDALGAEEDFDTIRLEFKGFIPHGQGHVFAVRQNNQLTHEAPTSAESTVEVRGYKMEQYLGKHMASIEAEERLRFSRRWGATLFGGTAYLYGSGKQGAEQRRLVSVRRGRHPVHREAGGPHAAEPRVRARQPEQLRHLPEVRVRVVRRRKGEAVMRGRSENAEPGIPYCGARGSNGVSGRPSAPMGYTAP